MFHEENQIENSADEKANHTCTMGKTIIPSTVMSGSNNREVTKRLLKYFKYY